MESLCWTRQVMNKEDQIRSLVVAIEEKEHIIRKLSAELGNLEVQIAEYRQIVQELSDKLKLYENKYGTVFKSSRKD
jgi:chromosome segregation ATPase